MSEVKDLIEISKYAGERFDLVQAGGGNSSVKLQNDEMLIKASGFLLSDLEENNGLSKVSTKKIAGIAINTNITDEPNKRKRESIAAALVQEATLDKKNRPSIETLLHSFLYKYTLHTHPIVVNMIVVRKDCEKILTSIFKDEDIAFVPYKTPGIELALELNKVLKNFKIIPKIIFLQNHGLIVTSPNKPDIKVLTEQVLEKIEAYLKLDMSKYKLTNKISHLLSTLQKTSNITFLSEDSYLNKQLNKNKELFLQTPFSPDSLVFCGVSAIEIEDLFDISPLEIYKAAYFELPKIIIFSNKLFLIAPNTRKAKEMEEVLKFHIMVLEKSLMDDKNFLADDELAYLNNWEAEKYRQKL
jgi:rhamnose utilization protein RhaD (predicted bifunctional aldolase and dehydrogenase)